MPTRLESAAISIRLCSAEVAEIHQPGALWPEICRIPLQFFSNLEGEAIGALRSLPLFMRYVTYDAQCGSHDRV